MSAPRVILGATCLADARAALALAVGLAAQLDREIGGLLIEEESFLSFAGAPAARVIGPAGQHLPVADAGAMAAAFRRDAAAFEKALAKAAISHALRWSFARRRAHMAAILAEAARTRDLVILGGARAQRPGPDIVLLSPADTELAALADDLASTLHGRLLIHAAGRGLAGLRGNSILLANLRDLPADMRKQLEHAQFTRLLTGTDTPDNGDM